MFVYIDVETSRQTDRELDRQADKQTERQAGKEADRPTDIGLPNDLILSSSAKCFIDFKKTHLPLQP